MRFSYFILIFTTQYKSVKTSIQMQLNVLDIETKQSFCRLFRIDKVEIASKTEENN